MEDEKVVGETQKESVVSSLPPEPPDVRPRLQPTGKGHAAATSCQPAALSSSDEEEKKEEVEVKVSLEIHSPPVDPPAQEDEETERHHSNKSRPNNPITPPPLPVLSCSTLPPSPQTPPPTTIRHWAPPKGFWRVARPETLLLNGVEPQNLALALPCKDYPQGEDKADTDVPQVNKRDGVSASLPGEGLIADEEARPSVYEKLKERHQNCRDATDTMDCQDEGTQGGFEDSIILQELEPYLRSLLVIGDELPLSPRHEQAKRLLERARLKARSNHAKGDRPGRRSHSDHRPTVKKQQVEAHNPTPAAKAIQVKEDPTAQGAASPLLVPDQGDAFPEEQVARSRRYGCSPTRVRFEDESEREAESRYLDRVRQRGRPVAPKSKNRDSNTDSSSSGSERSRNRRSISVPPIQKREMALGAESTTVIREIVVLVKKCQACGSVVREPQQSSSLTDQQRVELPQSGNPEDTRGRTVPCWVPPYKPEVSTRPKAPLTVTFAGAFVLGETKERSSGWKSSGFGKLRRRSRKGESRLESGNGPYGPSWAQRRNSNPRNRVNLSRGVSFAPDSPVTLEPCLLGASGRVREAPALPIKSALKSSSRNRAATGQFQMAPGQGGEVGPPRLALLDCADARREFPAASLAQGAPAISNSAACIRPSVLRYSPARLNTDVPAAHVWDATLDGTVTPDTGAGSEFHPAMRSLALSRTEDLRAELLRAEHLKAEAVWEDNSEGARKLDGRPKLFLRRFFSSIGLNSMGRLVKGGRSSSMEQLSVPAGGRSNAASPSPTRRPRPAICIQRTPSLQALHTALPLAQLRKASSVQSLERRTERTTILGEVQIPYGLAPSPDSPQLELHRTLSVEDVIPSRVVRPAGRVSQAFPDGSLLLELIRPPNGPFGFVISRGKGRPDTGVYVEKVGDGTGDNPYVGLLSVGDEIVQVNGEVVAGLSLDQVTRLMTQESVASLRIMPARRSPC